MLDVDWVLGSFGDERLVKRGACCLGGLWPVRASVSAGWLEARVTG